MQGYKKQGVYGYVQFIRDLAVAAFLQLQVIVGSIISKKKKSLGRYDSFNLVVTNKRLIVAQLTPAMMNGVAQEAPFFGIEAVLSDLGPYKNPNASAVNERQP